MGELADIAKTYTKNRIGVTFGLTHDRLPPNGIKTVTRRKWAQKHFMTMTRYMKTGDVLPVFDKSPRTGNAKQLGWMRIIAIRKEPLSKLNKSEVALEGYPEMDTMEFVKKFFPGESLNNEVIRVEFEFEPLALN